MNQKEPISNIVPKKEFSGDFEKIAERKNTRITPAPPKRHIDFGRLILPSKNLAKLQKITARVRPTTKSNPLEISIEISVKGRKKNGNNVITKKRDKNESRSKVFECIVAIIL